MTLAELGMVFWHDL
ncbi:TPA: type I toxin-antitoxin system toxin Ldr family protein, partial [Escherichia coli]